MPVAGASYNQFGVTDSIAVGAASLDVKPALSHVVSWADGDGAAQVEDNPSKVHTLTGGTDTIDLVGGFTRLDGSAITPTAVKVLYLEAPAANAGDVTVTFNGTNGWAAAINGAVVLKPGTSLQLLTGHAAGYAVTAGTADLVTVAGTLNDTLKLGLGVNV